jgi:hypothetical protein
LWLFALTTAVLPGLICISFMAKNTEHFFMNLLAIGTSFENYLANSFAHLLIGLFYSFGA